MNGIKSILLNMKNKIKFVIFCALCGAPFYIIAGAIWTDVSAAPSNVDLDGRDPDTVLLESIEAEVIEIETHLHSGERWYGTAASPAGETHIADRVGAGAAGAEAGPIVVDAGNDDWGTWTIILGSEDTPAESGKVFFDLRKILVVAKENDSALHFIQFFCGDTAPADDPSGDAYTEDLFISSAASPLAPQVPLEIQHIRCPAGTKFWMRTRIPNSNTGTISFYFGVHEYDE